jgi:alpha(1,3/1,4) fucosyltransferase
MKKLCVVNFWEGAFDGDFLEYFFNACCNGVTYTDNPHEADLVVTSVFGNVHTDPKKTIAFIGENIRPSYVGYDHSLSFDFDSYGGRNHRLPLWYARLAWPGFVQRPRKQNAHNHGYEPLIEIAPLTQPRKLDWQEKKEFCAMIAGNPEGLRVNLYNSISRYKPVDGYGNMFNRALRQSKFDVLKNYKFCLCPENSVYDGYVTEKLLDAYAGGTIPIYSGTMSVDCDFHEGAYLNYMDTKDMDWFITAIQAIDESKEIYEDMYNRPLLWEPPSLDNAIAFVRNIVK